MAPLGASLLELNAVLAQTAFLNDYNFELQECTPSECHLRVPFEAKLERRGGIVSGMPIMGAADVAMWLAIMTIRGTEEVWVTFDRYSRALSRCYSNP